MVRRLPRFRPVPRALPGHVSETSLPDSPYPCCMELQQIYLSVRSRRSCSQSAGLSLMVSSTFFHSISPPIVRDADRKCWTTLPRYTPGVCLLPILRSYLCAWLMHCCLGIASKGPPPEFTRYSSPHLQARPNSRSQVGYNRVFVTQGLCLITCGSFHHPIHVQGHGKGRTTSIRCGDHGVPRCVVAMKV